MLREQEFLARAISFDGIDLINVKEGNIQLRLSSSNIPNSNTHHNSILSDLGQTNNDLGVEDQVAVLLVNLEFSRIEAVSSLWCEWFQIQNNPENSVNGIIPTIPVKSKFNREDLQTTFPISAIPNHLVNNASASSISLDTFTTISASNSISNSLCMCADSSSFNYFDYIGDHVYEYFGESHAEELKQLLSRIKALTADPCKTLNDMDNDEAIRKQFILQLALNELCRPSPIHLKGYGNEPFYMSLSVHSNRKDLVFFFCRKPSCPVSLKATPLYFDLSLPGHLIARKSLKGDTIEILATCISPCNNLTIVNKEKFAKIVLPILIQDYQNGRSHLRSFPVFLNDHLRWQIRCILQDIILLKIAPPTTIPFAQPPSKILGGREKSSSIWRVPKYKHVYLSLLAWDEDGKILQCNNLQSLSPFLSVKLYSDWEELLLDPGSMKYSSSTAKPWFKRILKSFKTKGQQLGQSTTTTTTTATENALRQWSTFSVPFCQSFEALLNGNCGSSSATGKDCSGGELQLRERVMHAIAQMKDILPMLHKRFVPFHSPVFLGDGEGEEQHIHIVLLHRWSSSHVGMMSDYLQSSGLTFSANDLFGKNSKVIQNLVSYEWSSLRRLAPLCSGIYVCLFALDYEDPRMVRVVVETDGVCNIPAIPVNFSREHMQKLSEILFSSSSEPCSSIGRLSIFLNFESAVLQKLPDSVSLRLRNAMEQNQNRISKVYGPSFDFHNAIDEGYFYRVGSSVSVVNIAQGTTLVLVPMRRNASILQTKESTNQSTCSLTLQPLPIFEAMSRHTYGKSGSSWIMDMYRSVKTFSQP